MDKFHHVHVQCKNASDITASVAALLSLLLFDGREFRDEHFSDNSVLVLVNFQSRRKRESCRFAHVNHLFLQLAILLAAWQLLLNTQTFSTSTHIATSYTTSSYSFISSHTHSPSVFWALLPCLCSCPQKLEGREGSLVAVNCMQDAMITWVTELCTLMLLRGNVIRRLEEADAVICEGADMWWTEAGVCFCDSDQESVRLKLECTDTGSSDFVCECQNFIRHHSF